MAHLETMAQLLISWNRKHNLVSARSLDDLWRRHFWDCAQIAPHIAPDARTLVDFGSGAGFPGLVLAEILRGRVAITMFEATAKKCAFLVAAAEAMTLPVRIRSERIEDAQPQAYDVVTARACAPLARLIGYAQRFCGPNTVCLFLKGRNVGPELTIAHKSWKMNVRQIPSLTDPSGVILALRGPTLERRTVQKAPDSGGR
ncbi:MAG: 16S rRNA (guanine(527)-N(7))-methyltransferase RsmG [Rhizomicrobium sp.]